MHADTFNESQREAIAQADAFATNAGLPAYSHLLGLWLDKPSTPPARLVEGIAYTIGQQFAGLVEYGEEEGLTPEELADFQELEQAARDNPPEGFTFSHWAIDTDTADEFARCEATGLHGACYQFEAVYFHKDA